MKRRVLARHHRNAERLPQQGRYDPEPNLFMLGELLPEGMMFPLDFDLIPSTIGEGGNPLDVLVLMDAPAHVGDLIQVRLIGVISAGKKEINDRLLAVAIHSSD